MRTTALVVAGTCLLASALALAAPRAAVGPAAAEFEACITRKSGKVRMVGPRRAIGFALFVIALALAVEAIRQ